MTSLVLPTGVAKIASARLVVELALGDPAEVAAGARVRASELSRARAAKSAPLSSTWSLRAFRWSTSVGRYMTWMTCQPKADLTGGRMSPALRPGAMIAAMNAGSTLLVLSKYGSLPPVPVGPSAALLVALLAGDRVEQLRFVLEPGVGGRRLGPGRRPGRIGRPGPSRRSDGSPLGEYRMWRTLIASAAEVRSRLADVDLGDVCAAGRGRSRRRRSWPAASRA